VWWSSWFISVELKQNLIFACVLFTRRRRDLNPPSGNEFDFPLLCALVFLAGTIAYSAEDTLNETKTSQRSAHEEPQVEDRNNLSSRLSAYSSACMVFV
jgi:hypothetical protein